MSDFGSQRGDGSVDLLTLEAQVAHVESTLLLVRDVLPSHLSVDTLIPVSPVAFLPGRLIHTNELTCMLGDGYFVKKTAQSTVEFLQRKLDRLEEEKRKLESGSTEKDSPSLSGSSEQQQKQKPVRGTTHVDHAGYVEIMEPLEGQDQKEEEKEKRDKKREQASVGLKEAQAVPSKEKKHVHFAASTSVSAFSTGPQPEPAFAKSISIPPVVASQQVTGPAVVSTKEAATTGTALATPTQGKPKEPAQPAKKSLFAQRREGRNV